MKKLLTLLLTSSLFAVCSKTKKLETKKTEAVKKASTQFMAFEEPTKFAYATDYGALEDATPETNLVARELYKSALKYNYTLPSWPKSTEGIDATKALTSTGANNYYNLKWTTGDNAKKASEVAAAILKKWEGINVKVGFIQTNPETKDAIVNGKALQDAIKDKVYTGKLVLTGKNTSYVDLHEGKKGGIWSDYKNVATFEFSEITTAYNTGYLTQSQFGKVKNSNDKWEKRTTGYIVAALKKDDKKWNVLQMKKANAFRQGVLDAVKEQETGAAKFINKSDASSITKEKTLMFESTDIEKYFKVLRTLNDYTNNDHSFVYYAGADAEINDLVATQLLNSSVSNSYGHKLVVETAGYNKDDEPRGFGQGENGKWSRGAANDQAVTARIFMSVKPWIKARVAGDEPKKVDNVSTTWESARKATNAYAVEAVISSLYGENTSKVDYFGKHTFIGAFPDFTRIDTNGVPVKAQKIDNLLLDQIRKHLFLKNKDINKISDDFLGSGL